MSDVDISLQASTPFSLHSVVHSHGWVQLAPFALETEAGVFSYVTRLDSGRVIEYEVTPLEGGARISTATNLNKGEQADLARQVRWMLGLDQDLAPFYEQVQNHPRLGHVVPQARGRILRSPTLFEDVVKTILTTNTTWAGTIRMTGNLVAQAGDALTGASPVSDAPVGEGAAHDTERRAFPAPQRLAAASVEALRKEMGLGYRAPYVLALARAVDGGELDLEGLKHSELATPDLRRELLKIKGVGNYAAANLLLILGRYDHIPIDSWALRMVSQEWHGGETIGPAEVEEAFAEWGPWKGLAYWFWEWKA